MDRGTTPRCAFGVATYGYDVALEGRAARVTDEARLQRLAEVFAEGGGAPTVAEGCFTHEFSAPSAGPPPWYVDEFTPEDAYAVAAEEPGGATRWTFWPLNRVTRSHRLLPWASRRGVEQSGSSSGS